MGRQILKSAGWQISESSGQKKSVMLESSPTVVRLPLTGGLGSSRAERICSPNGRALARSEFFRLTWKFALQSENSRRLQVAILPSIRQLFNLRKMST